MAKFRMIIISVSVLILSAHAQLHGSRFTYLKQVSSNLRENAAPSIQDSSEVSKNFQDFITTFDRLEWIKFINYFSDNATVFFFFPNNPGKASGKKEIESMFRKFFDDTRLKGGGPSYLHLNPENVSIQMLTDAAVVSFYIKGKSGLGRRTLVFQKIDGNWKVIHLHASNIAGS